MPVARGRSPPTTARGLAGPSPCESRAGGGGEAAGRSGGGPSLRPSSRYSAEAQALDHKCSCCQEERTRQQEVVLSCPDGSSRNHTYTHIESCLCQDTACEPVRARRAAPSRARHSGSQALRPGRG